MDAYRKTIQMGRRHDILEIFTDVLNDRNVRDVGGYPQFAEATAESVQIRPIITPSDEVPDTAVLKIFGFNAHELGIVEGYRVGFEGIGVGMERLVGRNALRAKGIDPDAGPVSKEVQNTASVEAMLSKCAHQGLRCRLDANYSLARSC